MAKILLVEDDINLREIYAARLQAEGYEVAAASDGEEALAKSIKEKPDLILLDIMMPKISGFDVLDILRSTPETQSTKVIMLTALSQKVDRERGEKLGVNMYLVKSQITLEDVVQTIKQLLEKVKGISADSATLNNSTPDDNEMASEVERAVDALKDKPEVQLDKRPRLDKDSQIKPSKKTDKDQLV